MRHIMMVLALVGCLSCATEEHARRRAVLDASGEVTTIAAVLFLFTIATMGVVLVESR